ncbi:hypothetical protein ONA70_22405 [Micromonospora yasonensis]|nr:hypothetical protein [Micromonospora yasonensis]MCW3842856.1 hypothetical protein [Micromonospora yasonensis]
MPTRSPSGDAPDVGVDSPAANLGRLTLGEQRSGAAHLSARVSF